MFVHESVLSRLYRKLLARTQANIVVGDPWRQETNFGALISKTTSKSTRLYWRQGIDDGATLLTGGSVNA